MNSRTCVVCRKPGEAKDLLRFCLWIPDSAEKSAQSKAKIVVDVWAGKRGRGAYCHSTPRCLLDRRTPGALRAALLIRKGERGEVELPKSMHEVLCTALQSVARGEGRPQRLKSKSLRDVLSSVIQQTAVKEDERREGKAKTPRSRTKIRM